MNKFLIVEDEIIIAFHLETLLHRNNYLVCDKLTNAHDAVKATRKLKPDLILMDIMLADNTNGLGAAIGIRQFSDVPLLFMSALSDKKTYDRIRSIKNSILINKPFEEGKLLSSIKEML